MTLVELVNLMLVDLADGDGGYTCLFSTVRETTSFALSCLDACDSLRLFINMSLFILKITPVWVINYIDFILFTCL